MARLVLATRFHRAYRSTSTNARMPVMSYLNNASERSQHSYENMKVQVTTLEVLVRLRSIRHLATLYMVVWIR